LLAENRRSDSAKKNFERDRSILKIKISHNSGVTMNVTVRKDISNHSLVYNVYANIMINDRVLKMADIDVNVILELVKKYKDYVEEAVRGIETQSNSIKEDSNILIKSIGSMKELEDLTSLVRDPRKIDIYTIDAVANIAIARTIIELDSDVITVLQEDLLDNVRLPTFLNFHQYNVFLVNQLFESRIKMITYYLVSLNKVLKFASVLPLVISLISPLLNMSSLPPALPAIIIGVATPFLYKYIPRIIFRYMPKVIMQVAPSILGHLAK
jgi:hypothetical protein